MEEFIVEIINFDTQIVAVLNLVTWIVILSIILLTLSSINGLLILDMQLDKLHRWQSVIYRGDNLRRYVSRKGNESILRKIKNNLF